MLGFPKKEVTYAHHASAFKIHRHCSYLRLHSRGRPYESLAILRVDYVSNAN